MVAKGNNQEKGKTNLAYAPAYAPKPNITPPPKKDNPAMDAIFHQCGEVGHWRRNCSQYLAKLMKKKKLSQRASTSNIFTIELFPFHSKSWVYDTGCGTHIYITTQGLKGSKKLKPGALNLYVGNGHRAAIEAIGNLHLCLLSGLVVILNNYHYAPSITRGIISLSLLKDNGFVNCFIVFQKEVENQLGKTIKSLRSDRGGEYTSQDFLDHLKEHEIISHRTPPYTPQHNGVSERRNETLIDMVHSMMSKTTLPKSF
ncbi:retrotransposon protein, putative, ty1-copia subclass [Tanacetum coccineum]